MEFLVFTKDHEKLLIKLLNSRDMSPSLVNIVPQHGIIATKDGEPIGAVFLRMIEGNYAMFDSAITNLYANSDDRHEAISGGVQQLLDLAKQLKIKRLLTFSTEDSLNQRARDMGFSFLPMRLGIMDV